MLTIVRIIVTTALAASGAGASVEGTSPGRTVIGLGAGACESTECMSPAKTGPDRAHARATAITKRFMVSPFEFARMQGYL